MGKRLITQRRGRGTFTYRAHSHRFKGTVSHRPYDAPEKNSAVKGRIAQLLHCPGHSSPLAEIVYENNDRVLITAPMGVKVDDKVASGAMAEARIGNTLPLKNIPEGMEIFNIESCPGDGGKFCRSSGAFAKILAKTKDHVIIKFPSKKQKSLNPECRATIGIIAGSGRKDKPWVKAGKRWHAMHGRGKLYPRTSGVCMNAVDHPFGSGRGKHVGKPKTPPRFAPPGRNIGLIRARRTGKKK